MKICTIFTGGTIGSKVGENGFISPKHQMPYRLLDLYKEKYLEEIVFDTVEPYCILSENLEAKYLRILIDNIIEQLEKNAYEGIIITHGTDTLQYTSAILGYIFGDANIPILLVSSDYPLEDIRANGLENFTYAVQFIKEKLGTGVFVSYCNKGGEPTIHRGTRLQPHASYLADVYSVGNAYYGKFVEGVFSKNERIQEIGGEKTLFPRKDTITLSENGNEILRVVPYVGMQYPAITENIKAVLLESYHSGTIFVGDRFSEFMKNARERKVPVFLHGLEKQEKAYDTVRIYQEMGVIPLDKSSVIAQYCKLWLSVCNGLMVEEVMQTCVAGDIC
ncbi:MAG: asparaginase [Lachnospiraceae bacterium]|nr:asparaginase [Lachnospiraceae bacterium]